MLHIIVLLLAVAALWAAWKLSGAQEKFQPEMLDRSQDHRTQVLEHSSYEQRTNHMPRNSYVEPASGMATPFQVNVYKGLL